MTQVAERQRDLLGRVRGVPPRPGVRRGRPRRPARARLRAVPEGRVSDRRATRSGASRTWRRSPPRRSSARQRRTPDRRDIEPFLFGGMGPQIVVVNGRVSKALSSLDGLPAGVTIESAASRLGDDCDARAVRTVRRSERRVLRGRRPHSRRAEGRRVAEPIHVLAVSVATGQPALVAPRLVDPRRGSRRRSPSSRATPASARARRSRAR